jgi:pimeloyl-ACP methyl ester carboxylesterase
MNGSQHSPGHLSRRALVQGATLGMAIGHAVARSDSMLAAPGLSTGPRRHTTRALTSQPETIDDLLQTPLGEQLEWLLAYINGGGESLDATDLTAHVTPSFLTVLPEDQLVGFVQQIAAAFGTLEAQGLTRPPTEHQAVALVNGSSGGQLALAISIEADAPHLITGANPYPVPTPDGSPLRPLEDEADGNRTGGLVDAGGRSLYLTSAGEEGPAVVFEAGLGDSAAGWAAIESAVRSFAGVCSYDRANTFAGASDPAPTPRTAEDMIADLHELLGGADVPGPYVLVGHSLGGIVARLYASRYPEEVQGLVLVDASHEDYFDRLAPLLSDDTRAMVEQIESENPEGVDMAASFDEMRSARTSEPLKEMPLFVLTAGVPTDPATVPPDWPFDADAALWTELQEDLAGLVAGGRRVVAEQSGHYIHQGQPDLVVDAIRQVVEAVRDPTTWGTPSATPQA